jgi:hypothetical protein
MKTLIGKKSKDILEPGYIYAPYIPITTSQVIMEYGYKKNTSRKRKINNIFELDLDIKDDVFLPSKPIMSRYSKKIINNNFYQTIEIKKPTL